VIYTFQKDRRKRVLHSTTISANKANMESSSSFMQYAMNNRLVMAMKMTGCGGLHASVLLAFLDIPNSSSI